MGMDIDVALVNLVALIVNDGTPEEIQEQAEAIAEWVRRGGYRPCLEGWKFGNNVLIPIR